MFPIRTKNRKAISAVLTTIIILVASIVLGTGVVVYSTSLFQSGGSQQAIQVQGLKGWVASNFTQGYSWGAFAVKNTGDKLVSINSITLRGVAVPYTNMYSDINQTQTAANFQSQLITTGINSLGNMQSNPLTAYQVATCPAVVTTNGLPNEITISENGTSDVIPAPYSRVQLCLLQQSGPVSLLPGNIAIIYFKDPNGLYGTTDVGVTSTVSVLAGTAPVAQTIRLGSS
ncbi:MAG TPA: hypothetical protein VEU72_05320 [Nitrosopumilaceae archaeon]|nr:hypothetical protein [Nitrosopumilaceae archaeon]